jgi:glycosyltransferase involved in cell wall biosynthesis
MMRLPAESSGEWGHLTPLPLSSPWKRMTTAYLLAAWLARNHRTNMRIFYRLQSMKYGTATAIKSTAYQIGRTLHQMLLDRRRHGTLQFSSGVREWRSNELQDLTISVIIPTRNAGADLRPLLSTLKNQNGIKPVEIVIVDSGSTDQTMQVAREFGVSIIEIRPEEFSHSYARNLGAERSTADYLLFMVQDALPSSLSWIRELYQPMETAGVIASSCAEFPRKDSDLLYRALCWTHYRFLNVSDQDRVLQKPTQSDYASLRTNANVSNIACLIRRDVFVKYKFRGEYAEDLDLGLRLIQDGYKMALLGSTRVIHSHNRTAFYHLKRGYVDSLYLVKTFPDYMTLFAEAGSLIEEIVLVYESIQELVAKDLGASLKLYSISRLSAFVMDGLTLADRHPVPPRISPENNPNIDPRFQSFIASVYSSYRSRNAADPGASGVLLLSFRSFAATLLQYMQQIYDIVDEPLVEDFRRSLFKAFALICGFHLAASAVKGSPETREMLQELCSGLRESI